MRCAVPSGRHLPWLLAGAALASPVQAQVQLLSPDYALTAPPLLLAPGSGLSLQAGERWFARVGVGRSLEAGVLSVGGGYRFAGGGALSMHAMRQLGQDRLGLAVRYELERAWLRLAYESPVRTVGAPDSLRFSAGLRF